MNNVFLQLALVLSLSSFLGYFIHKLKLPLIVAYVLSGVILSIFGQTNPTTFSIFSFLPDLGIALVLFLIGMELDLRELKALGKPIIVSSLCQITISALAGYSIAGFFGLHQTSAVFVGIGLSFSSTLVVIQLLLDKRDLTSLYGKLSLGILLIEDIVAIIALMLISVGALTSDISQNGGILLILLLKAIGLFVLTFFLSKFVLQKIFNAVAKSPELLFLTAITWCFLFTSVAVISGFSVVIGAFLAGIALASSPYHLQIQGKIKPLRDFFVALFFIYLGAQVRVADLNVVWPIILSLTAYAVLIKPFIFLLILGIFGFRKHTIFQTALNLSQISEFSLVIALLGVKEGVIPQIVLSAMAPVAVLSVIISSTWIANSKKIYQFLNPILPFFEHTSRVHYLEAASQEELEDHVVIVGAHRVGGPVVEYLKKKNIPFIVMDFNPHIVESLKEQGLNVIYGDIGDVDVLESLKLEKAKLIISTARDMNDNEVLLETCKRKRIQAKVVARALDDDHAKALRALGADYIIMPEQVSGDFLVDQLKTHWPNVHFSGLD